MLRELHVLWHLTIVVLKEDFLNILITGGAGFIGSALAEKLSELGHDITVLDSLSPQVHGKNSFESVLYRKVSKVSRVIIGNVTIRQDWIDALKGQDIVVHFAAETGTGQSMYEIERYMNVNVQGTAVLLDILANSDNSVRKIILASSRAIYGEGRYIGSDGYVYPLERRETDLSAGNFECRCPNTKMFVRPTSTDENSIIHPSSIYGISKQAQEELVLVACKTLGIAAFALRYQNVYGPGQSLSNPYTGILSIFSSLLLNGKDINVFEDGGESRDFVYIDDAIDATVLSLEAELTGCYALNVGSGDAIDVLSVAQKLKNIYGVGGKIEITGNYRVGDIRHNYADLKKIKDMLGYSPKVSFANGLERFAEWVKSEKIEKSLFERSIEEMKGKGIFK